MNQLEDDPQELEELDVDPEALAAVLAEGPKELSQSQLDEVGLTDDTLYSLYGEKIYDTSEKLHKTAKVWGTDDFGGFFKFCFEGLVSGDKYGSAVGIAALILVVGGAFGIIMQTGAIDAGSLHLSAKPVD